MLCALVLASVKTKIAQRAGSEENFSQEGKMVLTQREEQLLVLLSDRDCFGCVLAALAECDELRGKHTACLLLLDKRWPIDRHVACCIHGGGSNGR